MYMCRISSVFLAKKEKYILTQEPVQAINSISKEN